MKTFQVQNRVWSFKLQTCEDIYLVEEKNKCLNSGVPFCDTTNQVLLKHYLGVLQVFFFLILRIIFESKIMQGISKVENCILLERWLLSAPILSTTSPGTQTHNDSP